MGCGCGQVFLFFFYSCHLKPDTSKWFTVSSKKKKTPDSCFLVVWRLHQESESAIKQLWVAGRMSVRQSIYYLNVDVGSGVKTEVFVDCNVMLMMI